MDGTDFRNLHKTARLQKYTHLSKKSLGKIRNSLDTIEKEGGDK